jgi:hypothetical protein
MMSLSRLYSNRDEDVRRLTLVSCCMTVNLTQSGLPVTIPMRRIGSVWSSYVAGVARQIADDNVTINNVLPGTIATERIKELGDTANWLIAKVPIGRAGSTHAAYITGQNLLVDGGLCPITV